jgi:uncharacterized protein
MIRLSELKLPLSAVDAPDALLREQVGARLALPDAAIATLTVFKRSFDARKADILAVYIVDITLAAGWDAAALLQRAAGQPHIAPTPDMRWHPPVVLLDAPLNERPVVVGLGPCGLFAALSLAQMGLRPIVLERGKTVRERTKDTWGLWRKNVLHPESNVQFGEGGAGTFSDGKLYSQIKDPRHLGRKVIEEFVNAGAPDDILYAAHPHIGTFKLVKVVEHLRHQIEALGGEIRFEHRVVGLHIASTPSGRQTTGVRVLNQANGATHDLAARHVVLALGHSARDTFTLLWDEGVALEAKPFSIGVRIEHPQSVIDRARWGRHAGNPVLGAADYKLVHHASNGRTVYSFCMCPGGTVVAATSEAGRVVTNGMSQYSRNERNANAGLVVGIDPPDYPDGSPQWAPAWVEAFGDSDGPRWAAQSRTLAAQTPAVVHPLAGVVLQRWLERRAFEAGGGTYEAPGQTVRDFMQGQASSVLGTVQPSYKPGVKPGSVDDVLPPYATAAMREALPVFGRKIAGYDMPDAVLTAVETRTSAPLRIPRGADYQSTNTPGLYPAGEGAGYAGGILSAGVDGIKVAEAVARAMTGLAQAE